MRNAVFSLRLLPDNVRLHVIKSLNWPALIAFSLISTKAKALVESFNMKIYEICVLVEKDSLCINLWYKLHDKYVDSHYKIYYDMLGRHDALIRLDHIPFNIQTSSWLPEYEDDTTYTWRNPGLSFHKWFKHFQFLFKSESYHIFFDVNQEVFDTVALRNLLPEWKEIEMCQASFNYGEKISNLFSNCTRNFYSRWRDTPLQFSQKVGIQNLDHLNYDPACTLDDLLILNSSEIYVFKFPFSDLNRYLKNWVRGSNPRLRHASVFLVQEGDVVNQKQEDESELNKKIMLEGIKYQVKPDELERMMNDEVITGGIDIRNKNGILATIKVDYRFWEKVQLYVWD